MAAHRTIPLPAIGQAFGRWTVISEAPTDSKGNRRATCRCACGTEQSVTLSNLVRGRTRSCGCAVTSHGQYSGGKHSSLHNIWKGMLDRCGNPAHKQYADYGGRGIKVAEVWKDFAAFASDMGPRPAGHEWIERIDNDGNYEPANCRWATPKEQARNRRNNRPLTYRGETRIMVEWAEEMGLPYKVVKDRMHRGWTVDAALTTPYSPRT